MKQLMLACGVILAAACYPGGRGAAPARTEAGPRAEAGPAGEAAPGGEAPGRGEALRLAEAAPPVDAERMDRLERKLDEIDRKLDAVLARGAAAPAPARPARPEPDRAAVYAVPIDGDPVQGRADAKVTIVKAYDYACPYCDRVRATLDGLQQKYGKDLRVVYKQLIVHPRNATAAALAFCAAARQGKAFEMDRLLWEKGFAARQLDPTEVPLDPQGQDPRTVKCWEHPDGCKVVDGFAAELRLDLRRFKADLQGACQARIASDARELAQFGANATPAFFINGRYLSGAQPSAQFEALIDEELAKARERIGAGTPAASYYKKWVLEQGQKALAP